MKFAAVIGTGSYLPDNKITNDDLSELVDTSDEWIFPRTGISERRITTGESTSEIGYRAAVRALEDAGLKPEDIDMIICATITPDSFMPATACLIQDKLGAVNAVAYDLTAACTGLIYAAVTAEQFILSGMYRNILVIGAETLSRILDWEDRSTCVLFGDGAGALVLTGSDSKGILSKKLVTDASKHTLLTCPAIPLANPYIVSEEEKPRPVIAMQGQEVFKFAVRTITELINTLLHDSGLSSEDIKYVIPHQANKRIIEQAAKFCDMSIEKFYMNINYYGNTSAATIGIALDELKKNNDVEPGDKLILVGFGAGMTSGAVLLEI